MVVVFCREQSISSNRENLTIIVLCPWWILFYVVIKTHIFLLREIMSHPGTFPLLKGLPWSWVENYSIKYASDFRHLVSPRCLYFFYLEQNSYPPFFWLSFSPYFLSTWVSDQFSLKIYGVLNCIFRLLQFCNQLVFKWQWSHTFTLWRCQAREGLPSNHLGETAL